MAAQLYDWEQERWLDDVPLDHVVVDQCRRCGSLVARWVPAVGDPDQRPSRERHDDMCHGHYRPAVPRRRIRSRF